MDPQDSATRIIRIDETQPTVANGPAARHAAQNRRLRGALREAPIVPNYEILDVLGRGGMSVVYQARQHSPQREVALKVLRAAGTASERELLRFQREAAVVALLTHPYIVPIFECGETTTGELFYTMPMVQGEPLDAYVRNHQLSIRQIVELLITICEGIEAAHRHGTIHRDVKPGNILVTSDGRPQILDFGLAKLIINQPSLHDAADLDSDDTDSNPSSPFSTSGSAATLELSAAGECIGPPAYMAPEQIDPELVVDTRTDTYALGVLLYKLLTGRYPYEVGDSLSSVLRAIIHEQPHSARKYRSDLDADLDAILMHSLAKDKEARYQSAADLADDLRAWLARRPVAARGNSRRYRFSRFIQRNLPASILAVAAFVALNVVVVTAFIQITAQRDAARSAEETARAAESEARDRRA